MIRSSSEWMFEKFLEESAAAVCASAAGSSNFSSSQRDDEVVEIKKPPISGAAGSSAPPPDPIGGVDPRDYAAMLKQKLDMYCHAVAIARGSGIATQDSPLVESRPAASDSSQMGPQAHANGSVSKLQTKTGDGPSSARCSSVVQKPGLQGRPATSGSSREQSDDDDLEGETEGTDNMDPADAKRVRRMLSNRESARRSRRRKQAHLSELEAQVSQLRLENSTLLKRLTDINQKYSEASVDNRILKADVETLRAKVKMAEDGVKRVTGINPVFPMISEIPSISMPFSASPSDATSDAAVPIHDDDPSLFFQAPTPHDRRMSTGPSDIPPSAAPPSGGRTVSVQRVASLEHLQNRICGTSPGSSGSCQLWDSPGWNPEVSGNKKHN